MVARRIDKVAKVEGRASRSRGRSLASICVDGKNLAAVVRAGALGVQERQDGARARGRSHGVGRRRRRWRRENRGEG